MVESQTLFIAIVHYVERQVVARLQPMVYVNNSDQLNDKKGTLTYYESSLVSENILFNMWCTHL